MPSSPDAGPGWRSIILRALAYAGAITLLALYAPTGSHDFIYWGF